MTVFAHFTVHELPGTLAILVTGFFLGAWAARGRTAVDWVVAALAGLTIVGLVVAVLSDHDASVHRLVQATIGDTAWDGLWLAVAIALAATALRRRSRLKRDR
jgi:hypothetical protein